MGHNYQFILTILLLGVSIIVLVVWIWRWWGAGGGEEGTRVENTSTHPIASKRKKNKEEYKNYEKELDEYEAPIVKRRSRSKSNKEENPRNNQIETEESVETLTFDREPVKKGQIHNMRSFLKDDNENKKILSFQMSTKDLSGTKFGNSNEMKIQSTKNISDQNIKLGH